MSRRGFKAAVVKLRPAAVCTCEEWNGGTVFIVRHGGAELGRDAWSAREAWRQALLGIYGAPTGK
jgi:hypothetical protein